MIPDSPILNDIGSTVFHFFWQGSLIAFLLWLALRCLSRHSAEVRYKVCCTSLGCCLLAFLVTLAWESSIQSPIGGNIASGASAQMTATHRTTESFGIRGYTALAWVCGVLLMTTRLAGHCRWANHMTKREISKPDEKWSDIFENLKKELRVSPSIQMLSSGLAETPMVVGWITPVVLIPASAFVSLTPAQMSTILAHELAHIHRFDHWMNMLQGTIEIMLFFHPAIWWISKQIHIEREYCCDDTSIRTTGTPKLLAEALAHLEQNRIQNNATVLAATGGSLLDRITRILEKPFTIKTTRNTNHMKINIIAASVMVLFLTGTLFTAHGELPGETKDKKEQVANIEGKGKSKSKSESASNSSSSSGSQSESAEKPNVEKVTGSKSKSDSASKSSSDSASKSSSDSASKSSSDSASRSKSISSSSSGSSSDSKSKNVNKRRTKRDHRSESKGDRSSKSESLSGSKSESGSKSSETPKKNNKRKVRKGQKAKRK